MEKTILYLGGSPCSGKSTAARRISQDTGAYYYKADDDLDRSIRLAAKLSLPFCKEYMELTPNGIWMRDPELQCEAEFHIYNEIIGMHMALINSIDSQLIIAEGTLFTPEAMERYEAERYICLIPSPDFQLSEYQKRTWTADVLRGCTCP